MRKSVEMYWKWKKLADCSDVIEKIISSQELAYHVVTKFKRNMGICERIYQSLAVKKPHKKIIYKEQSECTGILQRIIKEMKKENQVS